jgi:hypothetical protein
VVSRSILETWHDPMTVRLHNDTIWSWRTDTRS